MKLDTVAKRIYVRQSWLNDVLMCPERARLAHKKNAEAEETTNTKKHCVKICSVKRCRHSNSVTSNKIEIQRPARFIAAGQRVDC